MKVLFLNPAPERCGVHQYGLRLYGVMQGIEDIEVFLHLLSAESTLDIGWLNSFDVVIYNRHGGIANAMLGAPYPIRAKQVAIFHEGAHNEPFDMWLFSDSSAPGYGNLVTIGRPLPYWKPSPRQYNRDVPVTIGLSGLVGAWATTMVSTVKSQLPEARVRIHLPPSDHCDPTGALARAVGQACREMCGIPHTEVCHDFLPESELLSWLERNDMNCYIRTPAGGPMSISSALDMALAVRRPIAINDHPMFRHIARVSPEICIERHSLLEILALGLSPLIKHYEMNDRDNVRHQVEGALKSLFLSKSP